MISIVRGRVVKVIALPTAALTLALGLGVAPAGASSSQICGNNGTGYCINAWNGGPQVKMYYGGYYNDDFYVQEVNRCQGSYLVLSTQRGDGVNCPFANASQDYRWWHWPIVEIADTNNVTQCVGSTTGSPYDAELAACADPLSGSGGGYGVIMVLTDGQNGQCAGYWFVDRYVSDINQELSAYLQSGGQLGSDAYYYVPTGNNLPSCWNGFQLFGP